MATKNISVSFKEGWEEDLWVNSKKKNPGTDKELVIKALVKLNE